MAYELVRIEQGGKHVYSGLSADTRPVSPPIGSEYWIAQGGIEKYFATAGWVQTHDASGAVHVSDVANPSGIARNRAIFATTGMLPLATKSATVTMTIATPGVVTWTAHGFLGGTPIVFTTTGALPTGLTAGTTYYVLYVDANTFQVAATPGGAAIATSGSQSGTHTGTGGVGVASWVEPGVSAASITAVRVMAGTLPTAANADLTVRYAIDSASDAAEAILLPVTRQAPSSTADTGQVSSFNLTPEWNGTSFALRLEKPIYIDFAAPITRLGLIHNIGTGLVLEFDISAVEEV